MAPDRGSESTWSIVDRLVAWLDTESPVSGDDALAMRVLKVPEELGEVAEAILGGEAYTEQDVQRELCDVILTTMVALRSTTADAQALFAHHVQQGDAWAAVEQRTRSSEAHSPASDVARQVLEIVAAAGTVAQTLHGVRATNPRKGASHTWQDLQHALCEAIFTSMVALRSITPDAEKVFAHHMQYVSERSIPTS